MLPIIRIFTEIRTFRQCKKKKKKKKKEKQKENKSIGTKHPRYSVAYCWQILETCYQDMTFLTLPWLYIQNSLGDSPPEPPPGRCPRTLLGPPAEFSFLLNILCRWKHWIYCDRHLIVVLNKRGAVVLSSSSKRELLLAHSRCWHMKRCK